MTRKERSTCIIVALIFTLIDGWMAMIAVGILHGVFGCPAHTIGYRPMVFLVAIAHVLFNRSSRCRRTEEP